MCVKIVGSRSSREFDSSKPLEAQIADANRIVVSYDPVDPKIDVFVDEIERLCRNGISCTVDIEVDANNELDGVKLERKIGKLKRKLDVNEAAKGLVKYYAETDRKLTELSELCTVKLNER